VSDLMSALPAWLDEFAWAVQIFVVVLAALVLGAVVRRFVLHLSARTRDTLNLFDDSLFDALDGPARGLVWAIGITWAAEIAGRETDIAIFEAVPAVRNVPIISMLTWFLLRLARSYEDHYVHDQDARGGVVDRTFIHAVGKLVRASIFITATLVVLQTFGISIAGLLAFGGMGGIAVGLAAQDLLANVFGGVTIYLDRPFAVGDWIRSPDQEIEGTVEEIGWRRTVIRTFDKRPLYVPNAVFTTISVENPARMLNRRIHETIGVRYDDVERVPAILADVREYLATSPHIDQSVTLMVNFNSFGASSLDFFIYCFTRTTVWTEFHEVKEEVLLHIAGIIAGHGAEIAFPTRTLHHVPSAPAIDPRSASTHTPADRPPGRAR
jgi:MscS family membrane protein